MDTVRRLYKRPDTIIVPAATRKIMGSCDGPNSVKKSDVDEVYAKTVATPEKREWRMSNATSELSPGRTFNALTRRPNVFPFRRGV